MKTTTTKLTEAQQAELDMDILSKRDLVLIKSTIIVFATVLNICCFQLFF